MEYDISVKKNEAYLYIPQDSLKSQDTLHKQSKVRTKIKVFCMYICGNSSNYIFQKDIWETVIAIIEIIFEEKD